MEKISQWSPLWIIFKVKIKIAHVTRTISASRRSFCANLITFERRSGLKNSLLKIAILRGKKFFSPERGSKVVMFEKNDRLDVVIVVSRDEQFLFFPWKWSKGGTIGWFFAGWNSTILLIFYLFLTFSHLTRIIQPHKIFIFIYSGTFWPHLCITSANLTFSLYLVFVVAVCVIAKLNFNFNYNLVESCT